MHNGCMRVNTHIQSYLSFFNMWQNFINSLLVWPQNYQECAHTRDYVLNVHIKTQARTQNEKVISTLRSGVKHSNLNLEFAAFSDNPTS